MKTMQDQKEVAQLKNLVFGSLISADNDRYPESVKQEIIQRYDDHRIKGAPNLDWKYILEPLGDDADKYMKILGS